jgi:hypothetical protein
LQQKNGAADNPYGGHRLGGVNDDTEKLTACAIEQASVPVTGELCPGPKLKVANYILFTLLYMLC